MADDQPTEEELVQGLDDQHAALQARVAHDIVALTVAYSDIATAGHGTREMDSAMGQASETADYVAAMPYPSDVLNVENDVEAIVIPPPEEVVIPPVPEIDAMQPTGGEGSGPTTPPGETERPNGPGDSGTVPAEESDSDLQPESGKISQIVEARNSESPGEEDPFESIEEDDAQPIPLEDLASTEPDPDPEAPDGDAGPEDPDPARSDATSVVNVGV